MERPLTEREKARGRELADQLAKDAREHPERHGRSTGPHTFEYGPPDTWRTRLPGTLRDGQGRTVRLLGSREVRAIVLALDALYVQSKEAE